MSLLINSHLTCGMCEKEFIGRKPPDWVDIFCQECLKVFELAEIADEEDIPESVLEHHENGGDDLDGQY